MKKILLTNDDGYHAQGIKALEKALEQMAEIYVVAPKHEKSACSQSITITEPLRAEKIKDRHYRIDDGTPSDCVYLAINELFKDVSFDLVVSGINLGSNMGEDTIYSGTVAGAIEGTIQGIPSIAISQITSNKDKSIPLNFDLAKQTIQDLVQSIFTQGYPLKGRKLLNVNIPNCSLQEYQGERITPKGYRVYQKEVHKRTDPKNNSYFWLGLHPLKWEGRENESRLSDFDAISLNYVSITPLNLDLTSYDDLKNLESWHRGILK
ncbi:5'/3'-nucleotidase SurE [Helicobacter cetorum]|uniref:5'-nucleotidase SurE n=1 Tax=Helicobacter cetorum (strain ATCC BAA-540 / CCUG 52418 / MIT 99-5656) TaxID=1163745 RepID=I0ETB7_HELCM|nr:5'/3'-nucleotidase SurE [Helicobacter cetorum]AFI06186.1 5'(3')-nucleotidase/polyphosphatase [Helicobacter cetorum MIT 99-5656]